MKPKLQFMLILLTYIMKIDLVYGIKCYACSVTKHVRDNVTIEHCYGFDESKQFEVDCPYSTMCEKRIARLHLLNGVQTSFERGCAKQQFNSMSYNYKDKKWVTEKNVKEVYSEGCFNNTDSETEYCYCRGNLCNSSSELRLSVTMCMIVTLLSLFCIRVL